jgi:hypothetical protein
MKICHSKFLKAHNIKMIKKTLVIALGVLAISTIPIGCSKSALPVPNDNVKLQRINSLQLTDESQGYGARPEIASNGEYIYIVYLGDLTTQRSHKVKIYDMDFNLISEKVLATGTTEYGGVTDIRISKDDNYVYSFYETSSQQTELAYLFGAKYRMDKDFTEVSENQGYLVQSVAYDNAVDGDETLNDPASVVINGRVYLMTQISYKEGGPLGARTLYKLREISSDLSNIIDTKDIDLSEVMDGWAGLTGLVDINGKVNAIQGNLVLYSSGLNSDFRMIRFDENWEFNQDNDVFDLTETEDITETMPVGTRYVDNTLFLSYRSGEVTKNTIGNPSEGELWLSMYDNNFELIESVQVSAEGLKGEHASVEVIGSYVYVVYAVSTSGEERENVFVDIFKF